MTWVAWRQQRASFTALSAVVGAYVLTALSERATNGGASGLTGSLAPYLWLFAGLFLGAPLVGREWDQGTALVAWGQSVTRRRWLAVRGGLVVLGTVAAVAAQEAVISGLAGAGAGYGPHPELVSRYFDSHGAVPFAAALVLVAFGVACGAWVRKMLPAMGLVVVAFVTVAGLVDLARDMLVSHHWLQGYWSLQLAESATLAGVAVLVGASAFRVTQGLNRRRQEQLCSAFPGGWTARRASPPWQLSTSPSA